MKKLIRSSIVGGILGIVLAITIWRSPNLPNLNAGPDVLDAGEVNYNELETQGRYNVAYFLGDLVIPERLRVLPLLEQQFGARSFDRFDTLVTEYSATPWDAIVIEESALSSIDATWLADIYWRGTIVVGININHNQLNSLIGRGDCAQQDLHPALTESYFLLKSNLILADLETDAAKLKAEATCSKNRDKTPIQGYAVESSSSSNSALDDAGYEQLTKSLQTYLDGAHQTRQAFAQHLHQKVLTRDAFIEALTVMHGISVTEAEKLWEMGNVQ